MLELTPTEDIAAWVGRNKREGALSVGFALETDNELENAKGKLRRKNLDMIVLNSTRDEGAGFGGDTNKISIVLKEGEVLTYPVKNKAEVAVDIVDCIENLLICSKN